MTPVASLHVPPPPPVSMCGRNRRIKKPFEMIFKLTSATRAQFWYSISVSMEYEKYWEKHDVRMEHRYWPTWTPDSPSAPTTEVHVAPHAVGTAVAQSSGQACQCPRDHGDLSRPGAGWATVRTRAQVRHAESTGVRVLPRKRRTDDAWAAGLVDEEVEESPCCEMDHESTM